MSNSNDPIDEMMSLTFAQLRAANSERLPQFKNRHGQRAHDTEDGSDWSPAEWLLATMGELGEAAQVRILYETGHMSEEAYAQSMANEVADVATYLDILARRALDRVQTPVYREDDSPAQMLMILIANLGDYANTRKKLRRGDLSVEEFRQKAFPALTAAAAMMTHIANAEAEATCVLHMSDRVLEAHPVGIDLGEAVRGKFNEVSGRVGSRVRL